VGVAVTGGAGRKCCSYRRKSLAVERLDAVRLSSTFSALVSVDLKLPAAFNLGENSRSFVLTSAKNRCADREIDPAAFEIVVIFILLP